ncbi:hypothetical protein N9F22_03395 [Alphaproteobacteria bacterium]|nr:hypothetical protein [Alphaproteobacteria bacterium]
MRIRIVAQSPAYEILTNKYYFNDIEHIETLTPQGLIDFAYLVLNDFQPDAVFCGVSSPDAGIDEFILGAAKKSCIKRFTFQDYWGYLNPVNIDSHDTIMVVDEYAASITAKQSSAHIEVVGNPKHDRYIKFKIDELRKSALKEHIQPSGINVVSFIGQPLSHLKGYFKTIDYFARSISTIGEIGHVIYRPHPREDQATQNEITSIFRQYDQAMDIHRNEEPIEQIFLRSNVITSLFSTAVFDAQILNGFAKKPFLSFLYFMMEDDIKDFFNKENLIGHIPYSSPPFATTVSTQGEIASALKQSLKNKNQPLRFQCMKDMSHQINNSSNLVAKILTKDFETLR